MRRIASIAAVAMITAGIVILADAGLTLAWKEPVSEIYSQLQQNEAEGELRELELSFLDQIQLSDGSSLRRLADAFEDELRKGRPIGRLEIPDAGIDYVFFEGTDTSTLQSGPGHYPETSLPGQGRTIGIAGHRTTYGAPFRKINEIEDGDEIRIAMPYAELTYEVEKSRIVEPTQTEIVRNIGRERLVLTACHPLYSAAQRYAIFAKLVDAEPAVGARA